MSINVTGSLPTSDTTDYFGFNTGTGVTTVTFNLTWATTGTLTDPQVMTMYVYNPSPAPLGTAFTGLQTQNNTYLIMPWTVDLPSTLRYISIQLSAPTPPPVYPLVAAGAYTLIITAN